VGRALASGGGAVQSFRSKWVRAKFRIEHQIILSRFLGEVASPPARSEQGHWGGASVLSLKMGSRIFKQSALRKSQRVLIRLASLGD